MELIGKQLTCDRCGHTIFLKVTEEVKHEDGSVAYFKYEKEPEGWCNARYLGSLCNVDSLHSIDNLCPVCHEELAYLIKEYMNMYRRDTNE